MTIERSEGATPPGSRPIETPPGSRPGDSLRDRPRAGDAEVPSERGPRSSRRKPSAYRVILEPRKRKPASTDEPKPVAIGVIRPIPAPVRVESLPATSTTRPTVPARREAPGRPDTLRPPALGPAAPPPVLDPRMAAAPPVLDPRMATGGAEAASSTPPPQASYAPGDVLADRYRLLRPIGNGGMGSVWRAQHLGLELNVAVKLVRRGCWVPQASERLLREARAAARVVHPAAVRVFDMGVTSKGDPFFVMELLHGRPLSRALAEAGPLAPVTAVQLVLPVIGALIAAHREGIVHRDIKPANVLLVEESRRFLPKLIDFGIAGAASSAGARKLTTKDLRVGSPAYMAPEQIRGGGDPDPRTDVWGVCFMLYELITGVRPGHGPSVLEPLREGRASSVLAEHPGLAGLLMRGLARSPEERWPTMSALGSALAAWALRTGAMWDVARTSLAVYCVPPASAPDDAGAAGDSPAR